LWNSKPVGVVSAGERDGDPADVQKTPVGRGAEGGKKVTRDRWYGSRALALTLALLLGGLGSGWAAEQASVQRAELDKARQLLAQGAYARAKAVFETLKKTGTDAATPEALDRDIARCNEGLVAEVRAQEAAEAEAARTAAARKQREEATLARLKAMRDEAVELQKREEYDKATEIYAKVSQAYLEMRVREALGLMGRGRYAEAKDILAKAEEGIEQHKIKIDPELRQQMAAATARMDVLVENRAAALELLGAPDTTGVGTRFLADEYFDKGKDALGRNDGEAAHNWLRLAKHYEDALAKERREQLPGLLAQAVALRDKNVEETRRKFEEAQAKQDLLERARIFSASLEQVEKVRMGRDVQMAEDNYQLALKAYDNLKLQDALKHIEEALRWYPMHKKAAWLKSRIEAELGVGERLEPMARSLRNEHRIRTEMVEVRLATGLQEADELMAKGQYEDAVGKYVECQSLVRYLRGERDLTGEENRIRGNLEEARRLLSEQKRREEMDRKIRSQEAIAGTVRALEMADRRERAQFLRMAYEEYTRGKYQSCIEMCEKIDQIDPGNQAAKELRKNAIKAQRQRDWQVLEEENREARRREVLSLKEKLLWQDAIVKYPSREVWREIERRGPVPLPSGEAVTTPADLDLEQALQKEVEFSFEGTPLKDVVDFLRQVVQKNLVLDERSIAEDERLVTMTLSKVPLQSALNLILGQDMGYIIKDGAIFISTRDRLRAVEPMDFRIYDVRDLTQSNARGQDTTDDDDDTSSTSTTSTTSTSSGSSDVVGLIRLLTGPENWRSVAVVGGTGDDDDDTSSTDLLSSDVEGEEGRTGGTMVLREPGDLLVNQTKRIHAQIEDILTKLRELIDVQVSIEARIVNFTDDFYREVGTNWSNITWSSRKYDLGLFTFPRTSWEITQITSASSVPSGQLDILPDFQVSAKFLDHGQAAAFIRAVKASTYAQVMQAPAITLINTNQGTIQITKNQAYVSTFTIGEAGAAAPTIATFSTGVTLDVTPVVSADRRYVELDLTPDISTGELQSFSFSEVRLGGNNNGATIVTTQIQQPVEDQQTVETVVRVPDRGTLVIGGLSRAADYRQESGIPFLANLPFLKRLFTRMAEYKQRQHLLMLVTPTILIQQEQEDKIPH